MKKAICIALVFIMMITMAGCEGIQSSGNRKNTQLEAYQASYEGISDESTYNACCFWHNKVACSTSYYDIETDYDTTTISVYDRETKENQVLPIKIGGSEYVSAMSYDTQGNLWLVLCSYFEQGSLDILENYYLLQVDENGKTVSEIDISELQKLMGMDEFFLVSALSIDQDGNFILSVGMRRIAVLNSEGELLFQKVMNGYVDELIVTDHNQVYMSGYFDGVNSIIQVDIPAKTLGNTIVEAAEIDGICAGEDNTIWYDNGSAFIQFSLENSSIIQEIEFVDSNVDNTNNEEYYCYEDKILALSVENTQTDSIIELMTMEKKVISTTEKKKLVYGCMTLDASVKAQIIAFNRNNQEYEIEIHEYMRSGMNYNDALTSMNHAITSSNCPDLIALDSLTNIGNLARNGVFENLRSYLNEDDELKLSNYISNVVTAYDFDDVLCGIICDFGIDTLAGKSFNVGYENHWTIADLNALMDASPNAKEIFYNGTKESVLSSLVMYNALQFIDEGTGTCNFDCEEFREILRLANRFPNQPYEGNADSQSAGIISGSIMLNQIQFNQVAEYQMYELMFNQPSVCVGYPNSENRCGSVIVPYTTPIAISSKSRYKEEAWQFIRSFLLPDYQKRTKTYCFPTLSTELEKVFQEASTPHYEINELGEKVEVSYRFCGVDDYFTVVYAATEDQINQLRNLCYSLDRTIYYDEQLKNIIVEEAGAYFTGQKSINDTTAMIQNKISQYINERE